MGFRNGAYARIWEINPKSDTNTMVRLSISKKNRATGEYEQDFSGFVMFVGTACAKKAAALKPNTSIKLGDVDVSTFYNKEKGKEYTNFKCFDFEYDGENSDQNSALQNTAADPKPAVAPDEMSEHQLPF